MRIVCFDAHCRHVRFATCPEVTERPFLSDRGLCIHALRMALALLPVLILALAIGLGVQRWQEHQRQQETAYQHAETALAAGDFDAAALGFGALGGYRDADDRLQQVQAIADPIHLQMDAAIESIATGDYSGAITMLEGIAQKTPGFGAAADLLASTRTAWIEQLTSETASAEANRDWLRAELALRELSILQPDDPAIAQQLQETVRNHATVAFARDGAVFLATGWFPEKALTAAIGGGSPPGVRTARGLPLLPPRQAMTDFRAR